MGRVADKLVIYMYGVVQPGLEPRCLLPVTSNKYYTCETQFWEWLMLRVWDDEVSADPVSIADCCFLLPGRLHLHPHLNCYPMSRMPYATTKNTYISY
jgi:hypothetical protein